MTDAVDIANEALKQLGVVPPAVRPQLRRICDIPEGVGVVVGMEVFEGRVYVATQRGVFVLMHDEAKDSYKLRPIGWDL